MSDEFEAFTPRVEKQKETPLTSEFETVEFKSSDDLACEVCGTPLVYAGRGRKPRFCDEHKPGTSRPRASGPARGSGGSQVEQAVQVMAGLYEGLNLAFFLADPTGRASMEWVGNVEKLHDQNRQFLAQNPKLAKQIVKMGTSTGTAGFVFAQGMAVLPPAVIAYKSVVDRRASNVREAQQKKRAQQQRPPAPQQPTATPGGVPFPAEEPSAERASAFDPGPAPSEDSGYSGPNSRFFG